MIAERMFRVLGSAALLAALFLSSVFPLEIAWENGAIENLQVVILIAAMGYAIYFQVRSTGAHLWYWRCAALVWLIMAGRELGWGANFYPPTEITSAGEPIYSSHVLPYIGLVHTALGIAALTMAIGGIRFRFGKIPVQLFNQGSVPWPDIVMILICAACSLGVDGARTPLYFMVGAGHEVFEELAELAVYAFFVAAQFRVRTVLQ